MSQDHAKVSGLTRGERLEAASPVRPAVLDEPMHSSYRARLAAETRDLLQRRIRAASLMLASAFGVLTVFDAFRDPPAWYLMSAHACLAAFLAAIGAVLAHRWAPSIPRLRGIELVTFGLVLACLIATQTFGLRVRLDGGELPAGELRLQFKNSIIGTLLLILTYGIFIPNHGRRAAWIIVLMALAPLVAPAFIGLTSSDFRAVVTEAWSPQRLGENALYLALAAAIAIFGTHTINKVHDDAFRARWLNQYRLTSKLGAGGMGEVYLARHHMLKRPCAIKLIRPGLSAKPRVLARFEREAQATAQLSHWNTVEVYDFGHTADGEFFYVMEYLPGLSLQQLVERHGPLPPGRVIYLLRQACDALAEAHEAGLIHRDLKPPNIFAAHRGGRYDVAKLLDFGLVKPTRDDEAPSLTREGMVTGSPLYMAPEQVMRSHPPDPRTDLYAVGAIAYFLLTGRPPFTGPDSTTVMAAQARDPVRPPSQIRADIPSDLEGVILRCLEKHPSLRFHDATSLEEALASCRDSREWSPARARAWWLEHEPEAVARQDPDPPGEPSAIPPSGTPLDDGITLAASAIEAGEDFTAGNAEVSMPPGEQLDDRDTMR